ncbi:MAG: molybdopterin-dependent oxidoreductase [Chloracidobacterium sp.]|nr:molybdopterin-dependent oxidoreductase [Chloracidobacterium sp.]
MSEDKEILLEKVREFEKRTGHTIGSYPDDPNNTASVLKERRHLSEPLSAEDANRRMFLRSLLGFSVAGIATWTGVLSWWWTSGETKTSLFRRTFEFNEKVSQFFYSPGRLAPEFPLSSVTPPRVNGMEGIEGEIDIEAWRLAVGGLANRTDALLLTLDDIKKLPRTEMITELKCIEGWSTIVHWAGVRFSDFAAHILPGKSINDLPPYVSMTTPDERYYVGWDTKSIMHPQTLLAYEMNGAPLKPEHGAPLRLASPTKYGIKQIKRIGSIEFTDERPKDYWAESGYDWYSGH